MRGHPTLLTTRPRADIQNDMSNETETDKKPAAGKAAEPVLMACTVLVAKTKVGSHLKGKGAKVRLPEPEAKALAGLGKVRIDGV